MAEQTISRALWSALDEFLSPRQRARVAKYCETRRELEEKHGAAFAELWTTAQKFIELNGRVRLPPTRWDFVPAAKARAAGNPATFDGDQASQLRDFWDWYLPVESNLTALIHCIHDLHKIRTEHAELFTALCRAAHAIHHQYAQWMEAGKIPWLPLNRGGDPTLNIVKRLGRVLIKRDTGPVLDDGDPGPQWEPL